MAQCELLERCGFFKKWASVNETACKGYKKMYCAAESPKVCRRKEYLTSRGEPPPDDMLPNGKILFS